MITQDRLKELVNYNPLTGQFIALFDGTGRSEEFRIKKGEPIRGAQTGRRYKEGNGYITFYLDRKQYKAHRLAFLYMTGNWPVDQVDHINGIPTDNRWDNLREANNAQNCQNQTIFKNNTSGYKGITWDKKAGKWRARVMTNWKTVGKYFDDIEKANEWRITVIKELHKEFATP